VRFKCQLANSFAKYCNAPLEKCTRDKLYDAKLLRMSEGFSFSGPWVGETMGHDSPAHVWEIEVRGVYVTIRSSWEGETKRADMEGKLDEEARAFTLGQRKAIAIGAQHFVIEKWDTNDMRNSKGRNFDVVFSRPGIAELRAKDIYRRYLDDKPAREAEHAARFGRAPGSS